MLINVWLIFKIIALYSSVSFLTTWWRISEEKISSYTTVKHTHTRPGWRVVAGRPRPRLQQTGLPNPGNCVDAAADCKRETCFSFGKKMETNRNHLLSYQQRSTLTFLCLSSWVYTIYFYEILFSKLFNLISTCDKFLFFYNRSASLQSMCISIINN